LAERLEKAQKCNASESDGASLANSQRADKRVGARRSANRLSEQQLASTIGETKLEKEMAR
jgi:hypothetical protein